jgi:hypothetical protein
MLAGWRLAGWGLAEWGLASDRTRPYLGPMPVLPPASSPKKAMADFVAFFRSRDRAHVIGMLLAILSTAIVVILFFADAHVNTKPPPQTIYVESWRSDRSDAEIIAQQKKDQAAYNAAVKARQQEFQKLQKKLGIE